MLSKTLLCVHLLFKGASFSSIVQSVVRLSFFGRFVLGHFVRDILSEDILSGNARHIVLTRVERQTKGLNGSRNSPHVTTAVFDKMNVDIPRPGSILNYDSLR